VAAAEAAGDEPPPDAVVDPRRPVAVVVERDQPGVADRQAVGHREDVDPGQVDVEVRAAVVEPQLPVAVAVDDVAAVVRRGEPLDRPADVERRRRQVRAGLQVVQRERAARPVHVAGDRRARRGRGGGEQRGQEQ
jgi:hypothetical protein